MSRPLHSELSPEDQILARRWTVVVGLIYSTIAFFLVAGILLTRSLPTTDGESAVARAMPKGSPRDVTEMRLSTDAPTAARTSNHCRPHQSCADRELAVAGASR